MGYNISTMGNMGQWDNKIGIKRDIGDLYNVNHKHICSGCSNDDTSGEEATRAFQSKHVPVCGIFNCSPRDKL